VTSQVDLQADLSPSFEWKLKIDFFFQLSAGDTVYFDHCKSNHEQLGNLLYSLYSVVSYPWIAKMYSDSPFPRVRKLKFAVLNQTIT
jgi:hypothetical protein